jgi:hypothetical protein
MPGIAADYGTAHAAELICGLIGTRAEHEVLASDPWTARVLVADRFATRTLVSVITANWRPSGSPGPMRASYIFTI